jgi:hypothetical protein
MALAAAFLTVLQQGDRPDKTHTTFPLPVVEFSRFNTEPLILCVEIASVRTVYRACGKLMTAVHGDSTPPPASGLLCCRRAPYLANVAGSPHTARLPSMPQQAVARAFPFCSGQATCVGESSSTASMLARPITSMSSSRAMQLCSMSSIMDSGAWPLRTRTR